MTNQELLDHCNPGQMLRSDTGEERAPLLALLIRLFDENPMIEDTYPEIKEVRSAITSGELIHRSEVEKAIAHEHAEYAKLQSAYLELKTRVDELAVVKTAQNIAPDKPISFYCSECNASNGSGGGRLSYTGFPYRIPFSFCPGCRAKIVEA